MSDNNETIKEETQAVTADTAPATEATTEVAAKIKGSKKKKSKIKVPKGKIFINSTYNNTIISVTDPVGNVIAWGSAGKAGFKGSKKSTPYAGGKTMEDVLGGLEKVIIDEQSGGQGVVPYLPLNQLQREPK